MIHNLGAYIYISLEPRARHAFAQLIQTNVSLRPPAAPTASAPGAFGRCHGSSRQALARTASCTTGGGQWGGREIGIEEGNRAPSSEGAV